MCRCRGNKEPAEIKNEAETRLEEGKKMFVIKSLSFRLVFFSLIFFYLHSDPTLCEVSSFIMMMIPLHEVIMSAKSEISFRCFLFSFHSPPENFQFKSNYNGESRVFIVGFINETFFYIFETSCNERFSLKD